ncbi:MAG: hypothetical protein ACXWCM_17545 [Acidimicrobiales bacterium]
MRQLLDVPVLVLEVPVLVGDVQLAPTTELAGLAELATTSGTDEQLAVLTRVAASIVAEDAARDHIARLRKEQALSPLPRRSAIHQPPRSDSYDGAPHPDLRAESKVGSRG